MSLLTNNSFVCSSPSSRESTKGNAKLKENCLLCRLTEIQPEKAQIVSWILSQDKSPAEQASLATDLTGIDFDVELISCLRDPLVRKFILSE